MGKHRSVFSIKVKKSVAEELEVLYKEHLAAFEPQDGHDYLLKEHMVQLYQRIKTMTDTMQHHGTLTMTACDALAFVQYWGAVDVSDRPLGDVLVRDIIGKINKQHIDSVWPKQIC